MSTKMKIRILALTLLMGMPASPSLAYKPVGWQWMAYPYIYDRTYTEWHWFNTANPCWVQNSSTHNWFTLQQSTLGGAAGYSTPGWAWWQWPWVYCRNNSTWYYFDQVNTTWVSNMGSGQWSVLGQTEVHTGEIQFTLTWDQPVDLDLHVAVNGEDIYFGNRVGTAGAIGGILDVDSQTGGPENTYWAYGLAPQPASGQYIGFQPSVKYWSGNVAVNYVLVYKFDAHANLTRDGYWPLSPSLSYTVYGHFDANASGLTQIPYSVNYYGR